MKTIAKILAWLVVVYIAGMAILIAISAIHS